jgi:hypothetical protein
MADVTVDEKPMAKLPIDPSSIPDAVKKRAAAVDALYNKKGQLASARQESGDVVPKPPASEPKPEQPSVPSEAPASQASAPADHTTPPAESAPAESAPAPPPPPEDENAGSWKQRYERMHGRYNASQKTLGEMQEQMTQLGNELLQTQQAVFQNGRTAPSPPPPPAYVTEQDVQNYGSDLINFTQRAAAQALSPKLQEIEQQNAELQRRLAIEARRNLDQRVELAVPNYREIDRDPRWRTWLLSLDMLSGRVRQQLLNEAIQAADAPRVISFFKSFLNEEQATGHIEPAPTSHQAAPPREPAITLASLAAPGRARPATGGDASVPPDKPTYTRAQVKQLYEQHRKGAYVGREAEWARLEADMFAAQREGRYR